MTLETFGFIEEKGNIFLIALIGSIHMDYHGEIRSGRGPRSYPVQAKKQEPVGRVSSYNIRPSA